MEHFKTTRVIKLKDEDVETLASCLELLDTLDEELTEFLNEEEDANIRLLREGAWQSYATLYDFLEDCRLVGEEVE